MNVQFKETKTNKIYEDFVKEPTDRKKQRAFSKQFGNQIASEIFKVRVTGSWRKFFNNVIDVEGNLLLKKDWGGDFGTIVDIYVIDVNNHEYDAV